MEGRYIYPTQKASAIVYDRTRTTRSMVQRDSGGFPTVGGTRPRRSEASSRPSADSPRYVSGGIAWLLTPTVSPRKPLEADLHHIDDETRIFEGNPFDLLQIRALLCRSTSPFAVAIERSRILPGLSRPSRRGRRRRQEAAANDETLVIPVITRGRCFRAAADRGRAFPLLDSDQRFDQM